MRTDVSLAICAALRKWAREIRPGDLVTSDWEGYSRWLGVGEILGRCVSRAGDCFYFEIPSGEAGWKAKL